MEQSQQRVRHKFTFLPLLALCIQPRTPSNPSLIFRQDLRLVSVHWWHCIVCDTSLHSTVWRKEKNGLQYRGASWTQRAKCPHSQFERGDFSLQLNDVTEQDGGIYTCKVVGEHRVAESRIMLIIIKGKETIWSSKAPDLFIVYYSMVVFFVKSV